MRELFKLIIIQKGDESIPLRTNKFSSTNSISLEIGSYF